MHLYFISWFQRLEEHVKSHESSEARLDCLNQLYLERERWRSVLKRLIAITLSLAVRNLAFQSHHDHLFEKGNGRSRAFGTV